jgi:hypothetical protein
MTVELPEKTFYVASYPRSGNTWLMGCLRLYLGAVRGAAYAFRDRDYFTHTYGEVSEDSFFFRSTDEAAPNKPLELKTHDEWDVFASRHPRRPAVYIYRDGRDAITSYYFYAKSFDLADQSDSPQATIPDELKAQDFPQLQAGHQVEFDADEFSQFVVNRFPLWARHVEGWKAQPDVLAVRYEDLHEHFEETLEQITEFLKIDSVTSLANVREEMVTHFKPVFDKKKSSSEGNNRFFRKGVVGDWANYFRPEDSTFVKHHFGPLMESLGYPLETKRRWFDLFHRNSKRRV